MKAYERSTGEIGLERAAEAAREKYLHFTKKFSRFEPDWIGYQIMSLRWLYLIGLERSKCFTRLAKFVFYHNPIFIPRLET